MSTQINKSENGLFTNDPMSQWVKEFPKQLQDSLTFPILGSPARKKYANAVICGMGGSAIGGDLLIDGLGGRITLPILVNRGPMLPIWVNEDTLVVASSYSGDTVESVVACEVALARKATVVVLTSGGRIGDIAEKNNLFRLIVPGGLAPRAALGYMFCGLWRLLFDAGVAPDPNPEIGGSNKILCNFETDNSSSVNDSGFSIEEIAKSLGNKIPWIWAPRRLASVARRWANQFSENSKVPAHWSIIPEAFHNEIIGLCDNPKPFENIQTIVFRDPNEEGPIERAVELLKNTGHRPIVIRRNGEEICSLLQLIALGDRISLALANQNGVPATPIPAILKLKS